jgi:hypothetical protein
MRRVFAALGFVALAGTLVMSFLVIPPGNLSASADRNAIFVIPASDGYGIANCLSAAAACGEDVAKAWCEAHGFARAQSFGPVPRDDYAGLASAVSYPGAERDVPLAITCAD